MILRQTILISTLVVSTLLVLTAAHPYGTHYEDDYVDEDEPMDPPSPFQQRPKPSGFAKKSSPGPVLSYPTAFDGAHLNVKATPSTLLQNQKFKVPNPKAAPVYKPSTAKPKTADQLPVVVQDEIPQVSAKPTAPAKKNVPNFVTLPPKDPKDAVTTTTTKRPTPKPEVRPPPPRKTGNIQKSPSPKPRPGNAAALTKKIRPASSIVSPKYAQHPTHTLATFHQGPASLYSHAPAEYNQSPVTFNQGPVAFNQGPADYNQGPADYNQGPADYSQGLANYPSYQNAPSYAHFVPTVEPTYQMVPAAQQEYNFASIGGALSGGPVVGADESVESRDEDGPAYGQQEYKQSSKGKDKDAKYEFMYRVQGDEHDEKANLKDAPSDFGHSEAREGDRTWGRYFVKLPDGRVQTVKYWADHTGYHAEVVFQGEAKHPEEDSAPKHQLYEEDSAPKHHPYEEDAYSNHSPSYNRRHPSFSPLTSPKEESSEQAQDLPIYEQEGAAHAHPAGQGPVTFLPQKPLYTSQPTFLQAPIYYEAAASDAVKAVEKLPKKSSVK